MRESRFRSRVLGLTAGLTLVGCTARVPSLRPLTRSAPELQAIANGCWIFERSPRVLSRWVRPGTRVHFDSISFDPAAADSATREFRVKFFGDTGESDGPRLSGWGMNKPQRIIAWMGNGFEGVELRLKLRGDILTGNATAFTDQVPSTVGWFSHPVRASRIACP